MVLHLSISNGFVSYKIYGKRDDVDPDRVNFPFLGGDVPHSASYGVYISQLIQFARKPYCVTDFNARNKILTSKLLRQGYRKNFFQIFIADTINWFLKSRSESEPEFYGDLVYQFKKRVSRADFSDQFRNVIIR